VPFLNGPRSLTDLPRRVVEQHLLLRGFHLPEQIARLLKVILVDAMIPMCSGALDR
jgi:hypothetical protein